MRQLKPVSKNKLMRMPVLIERLKMIRGGTIPAGVIARQKLSELAFEYFLREPDPNRWPPEMQPLRSLISLYLTHISHFWPEFEDVYSPELPFEKPGYSYDDLAGRA